jgi:hypothetical protein
LIAKGCTGRKLRINLDLFAFWIPACLILIIR